MRSAAMIDVPLPRKGSSRMSWRAEASRRASATSATGLTVGCRARRLPSSVDRAHGGCPDTSDVRAVASKLPELHVISGAGLIPCLYTKTNSCPDQYEGPLAPHAAVPYTNIFEFGTRQSRPAASNSPHASSPYK